MSEDLTNLHLEMMDKYFDEGWSQGYVSTKYNRHLTLVRKLIAVEKAKGRVRKKTKGSPDPRRREHRRPLSQDHWIIGIRVTQHRARCKLTMQEFGLNVGLSRVRVGEVESGSYDLTYTQMQRIAKELDMTVIEMITPREQKRASSL